MLRATSDVSLLRHRPVVYSAGSRTAHEHVLEFFIAALGWVAALTMLAIMHAHPAPVRWQHLLAQSLLAILSGGLLWKAVSHPYFAARFVRETTATDLGIIRMIACGVLAAMAYCEQIGAATWLPDSNRYSAGIMKWLYAAPLGVNWLTHHHPALLALKLLTIAALLLGSIGYRARVTIPLGAILYLLLGGIVRSYLTFTHNGIIPFFVVVVLCFTPCADGCSLDRRRRVRRGLPIVPDDQHHPQYAWARLALWCTLATCYVMAGMSKLRFGGWMWWDGVNLESMVFKTSFKPYTDSFIHVERWHWLPTWAFSCIGLFTLVTEIGMSLTPFSRRARRVLPFMAIAMHIGIRLLQTIAFWDLIALQSIFINVGWLKKKLTSTSVGQTFLSVWSRQQPGMPVVQSDGRQTRMSVLPKPKCNLAWRNPLRLTAAVSVLMVTWAMHVEFYPLTTIAMYSHRYTSGVLTYYWIVQTDATGATKPADLAMLTPESRVFHIPVWHAFSSPTERRKGLELLRFCGAQWNQGASPDHRITRLEIQRREWDYLHNRFDPEHGTTVETMSVDFPGETPRAAFSATSYNAVHE